MADEPTPTDDMTDDERMAAEWAAAAEGGDGATGDGDMNAEAAARVLNQDEIDSLLGFGEDTGPGKNSGIMAIVNSALVNYERLPMLELVFDSLVRILSTSLRNFTSDNVEVSLDQMTAVRFGDYIDSIPLPALMAIFKAEEWDNYGLMTVDSSMIYSIVDVLLGGRRGTAAMRIEGRPYTTIERSLIERLVHVILTDMNAAFDPLSAVTFRYDRLETNPRFATIARPQNAALLVKLRIDMEDRGGRVEIVIPYATLEPVRELLLQQFMGEKLGRDSIWETHLAHEMLETDMELHAVLDEVPVDLNEVLNWKPGSQLELKAKPDGQVEIRSGEIPLFRGRMGRKDGAMAVRVEEETLRTNMNMPEGLD